MEEEADSSKSAPAAPDNKDCTTTPATGTGWRDPGPAVGPWGEILTPKEAATIGGGWGDIGATGRAGWGQPTPTYPEAPGLPPADVAAIDPYWATRGTSWGGPPLPDQYAPDTPEHVQELEEEVTYKFFSKAAELPEPTEEAPPTEQGPQLISVTGGEYLYHRVPMEGLPTSEWPEAPSFPQPLITDDAVHSDDAVHFGNMDDITKIPKEVLEHLSVRAFAADANSAVDKGPEKKQNDEAQRHKYYQKTIRYRAEPETWHQRLGHPSHTTLKNSLRAGVFDDDALLLPRGGSLTAESVDPPCTVCPTASLAHNPFPDLPPGYERYKPLDKVDSDFMILSQEGLDGEYYTLTFIDACTRYVWAINTDCRSLAFECFVAWMKRAERQSGLKLKPYQTYGGLEFFSTKFKELFKQKWRAWIVLDYATHEVTKSRDCIFYEKLTLPIFKEHREAVKAPERIFKGHCSFATSHDEADLAEDADATDNTPTDPYPNIPLTSLLQTPTFIPVHQFDPADTLREAHNYNNEARRSPYAELPPPNTSQDTLRLGNDGDDNVVEVTSFHDYDRLHYEKTNETGLRILGLAVAVRHSEGLGFESQCVHFGHPSAGGCQRAVSGSNPSVCTSGIPVRGGVRGPLESRNKFILLVAYVDDLLYTGDDTELLDQFEGDIKEKLEVTINHNVTQFLGLNITQSATSIHLSAAKYAETRAKKFAVAPINLTTPYRTPPNHELDTTPLSIDDHWLYQQQLGCLLFATVTCRPDLSFVASQLAQYLKRPEGENLLDLRRALQYFVSTPDVGLTYEASLTTTLQLHGYIDAIHAGDIDNSRSRTGFIFQLQPAGLISWNSQKQELIALSSAEAESIAASAAVREGLYLMELLQEAKVTMNEHFTLFCDNQSAIKIVKKPGFVNRTKHIALRYFFVKDKIDKAKVKLTYCPTGDIAADFLTKKLPRQKFQHCTDLCGISKKSHVAHLQE
ncbi:unnamed protein product [Closterium sp. NIES-53]